MTRFVFHIKKSHFTTTLLMRTNAIQAICCCFTAYKNLYVPYENRSPYFLKETFFWGYRGFIAYTFSLLFLDNIEAYTNDLCLHEKLRLNFHKWGISRHSIMNKTIVNHVHFMYTEKKNLIFFLETGIHVTFLGKGDNKNSCNTFALWKNTE